MGNVSASYRVSEGITPRGNTTLEVAREISKEFQLFCQRNQIENKKFGILLAAICINDKGFLRFAKKAISKNRAGFTKAILTARDGNGFSALHYAASAGTCSTKRSLLHCIEDSKEIESVILDKDNISKCNVIQLEMMNDKCKRCVVQFLKRISPQRYIDTLFFCKDLQGLTLISRAQKYWEPEDFADFYSRIPNHVFIQLGMNSKFFTTEDFDCLPLTTEQISAIYPLRKHYIIPKNQLFTRKNALIFYTLDRREGAEEEATILQAALEKANFTVATMQWTSYDNLIEWLVTMTKQLADSTSVLFVAVMSHGFSGNIRGVDSSSGGIGEIVSCVRFRTPQHIPIVSMLYNIPIAWQIYNAIHWLSSMIVRCTVLQFVLKLHPRSASSNYKKNFSIDYLWLL